MDDIKRGEEIIKSVYKAALQALFVIGVKSPEYVEKFSMAFSQALDKEFNKIGLLQPPEEDESPNTIVAYEVPKRVYDIDLLGLHHLIEKRLKDAGFMTIEGLMLYMQEQPLTSIKGVKEKSEKQIIEKLNLWNTQN